MSTFKVAIESILKVENHPNADRLSLVTVLGWNCVTQKGAFKEGDLCVYFPIDSLLPDELEAKIFGPDSKVKLHNHRIKTIKLRGAVSQGLVVKQDLFGLNLPEGTDITERLGVKKYEPPVEMPSIQGQSVKKRDENSNFKKYTGIENAKNYTEVFKEGEEVVVTEKIHGTNFRAGYVKSQPNTFFKKLLALVGLLPEYEFVYGSHNVQQQNKLINSGYYVDNGIGNVYAEACLKYKLKEKLHPGQVVYGEIYGDGIQKGYTYGCKAGERKLILFDIMENGDYVDPSTFRIEAKLLDLPTVPVLYVGPYNKEIINNLKVGPSVLCPEQKVREGVVVKPIVAECCYIGRKVLKFINDEYLLKNQDNESLSH